VLCDCPGLVFPQFATTKADLVCDGVLPIDQLREYIGPIGLVVKRLPASLLEATYGLTIKSRAAEDGGDGAIRPDDFLQTYASKFQLHAAGRTPNRRLSQSPEASLELDRVIPTKLVQHDGS